MSIKESTLIYIPSYITNLLYHKCGDDFDMFIHVMWFMDFSKTFVCT